MKDPYGAFCDDPVVLPGAATGPLAGQRFGAKDVFDIAGRRSGAGNPDWLRTHPPARSTAGAVRRLLDAGATMAGKTHTDELTFSLSGENAHYGTPVNPAAPGRIPGGSSSGSASAVAGKLVDFALGTDTGGSVRLPASYCGILGFRPSHGRVANDHTVPLAPSFDTVGWFARDARLMQAIGRVLLTRHDYSPRLETLLLARDAFDLALKSVRPALDGALEPVIVRMKTDEVVSVYQGRPEEWMECFRTLQGLEIWQTHGAWIREVRPAFGPDVRVRFDWAASLDPLSAGPASEKRVTFTRHVAELLGASAVLCIPTAPSIAPLENTGGKELERFRERALSLLCIAGLAGLPQISLPLAMHDSCPLGISLVGPRNSDLQLLELACRIMGK